MRYTLRQLQIFTEVARTLSYTRAAEALHLTQPAVFAQVRQLEDQTGHALIGRRGKQLFLTEAGEAVLASAREIMTEAARLETRLTELSGLGRGTLRLAAVSTAKYELPARIGAFGARHPGIDLSLTVCNREELLERFVGGADDLYILGAVPEGLEAEIEPYAENPLVVIAPPGHAITRAPSPTVADLAAHPFLMRERGSGTRRAAERCFEEAGVQPPVRMELGANEAVKQGVMAGLGLSVLSRATVALELRHGYLAEVALGPFPLLRRWHVAWPKGRRRSLAADAFLAMLRESVVSNRGRS